MHTTDTTAADEAAMIDKLKATTALIRDWQISAGVSDRALPKRFPQIGSTRTWSRLYSGELDALNIEEQLGAVEAVWSLIEDLGKQVVSVARDDLSLVANFRQAYLTARSQRSTPARVIFVLADTSCGKSTAIDLHQKKWGATNIVIEGTDTWGNRSRPFLKALLVKLGVPINNQDSTADMLDKAVGKINSCSLDLVVDEAHHLRPEMLNALISLVNRTRAIVSLFAMPTLWQKLQMKAWEEVRQLTGNRMAALIAYDRPLAADVCKMLDAGLIGHTIDPKALMAEAESLAKRAPALGNMAFIREILFRAVSAGDIGSLDAKGLHDIGIATENARSIRKGAVK